MTRTTLGKSTIRCATGLAALSVALATTTACGLGQVAGHDSPGPQHAYDTASPAPRAVVPVRVRGHMGRPGVHARDAATS